MSVVWAYAGQAEVFSGQTHGNLEKSITIAATLNATFNYGIKKKNCYSLRTILPKAVGHLPVCTREL